MKEIAIILIVAAIMIFSNELSAQVNQTTITNKETKETSALSWKSMTHDFGTIKRGNPASVTFEFTNTGKTDILLTNVKGSCGCTATEYTREAIKPGQKGQITATYNAANPGTFNKTVTVITSASPEPITLSIQGTVVE